MKKHSLLGFLLILFIQSCKMSNTYVQILEPGAISLPPEIKSVVLLDRTITETDKKSINILESVLTGEGMNQDKHASKEVLAGLNNILLNSPRFQVKMANEELKRKGIGGTMPDPLETQTINKLCDTYQADAVAVLEVFDSDCIITNSSAKVNKAQPNGTTIPTVQFNVNQAVTIKTGFRIYDKKNKSVSDQYYFTHRMNWNTSGTTLVEAMTSMTNRKNAINQASFQAGQVYARRISPTWTNVGRSFFKKNGSQMAKGARRATMGDWKGAAEAWQPLTNSSRKKTAGRAAYNMALTCEMNGDLNQAKIWLDKSYGDYNCKKAKYYVYVINQRLIEVQRLNKEMPAN